MRRAVILLSMFVLCGRGADTKKSAPDATAARPNPDATFHAPPKPLPPGAVAGDWPSLLGPAHNMTSPETKLLRDFSNGPPGLVWEMNKGEGYAAPAVADNRLVLFHRIGDDAVVDCLDAATGARFWRQPSPTVYRDRYGYNRGPRCAPAIAGGRVFALGADGHLHAFDLADGRRLWSRDLLRDFGAKQNFFGAGSTPLVEGDVLVVNVGAPDGTCVAAFDVRNGRVAWTSCADWGSSYAAPVPATLNGRRHILVFAGGESDPPTGGLLGIDPAGGRVRFSFPWRGARVESVNASAPVVLGGNRIFVSECYGAGGVLLDVAGDDTVRPAWTNAEFGTHFMTAVEQDGFLYGVDGHGPGDAWLCAVDAKTGRAAWRTQPRWTDTIRTPDGPREIRAGTFRCWLLPVDGRCLCLGEYGDLLWLDLNPKAYTELSRARLFAAPDTWTPPVLSRGLLYVCQNRRDIATGKPPRLLCYDLRGGDD